MFVWSGWGWAWLPARVKLGIMPVCRKIKNEKEVKPVLVMRTQLCINSVKTRGERSHRLRLIILFIGVLSCGDYVEGTMCKFSFYFYHLIRLKIVGGAFGSASYSRVLALMPSMISFNAVLSKSSRLASKSSTNASGTSGNDWRKA